MKEKLIIKNFGPIKSVELELGRVNVLIGEQATGKSTVAKLLALCRYFSYLIPTNEQADKHKDFFEEGLRDWGMLESYEANSFIRYECEDYIIEVKERSNSIFEKAMFNNAQITYQRFYPEFKWRSAKFQQLQEGFERSKVFQENSNWITATSFFRNEVKQVLNNPFYVPTERGLQSFFSIGKGVLQNFTNKLFEQLTDIDTTTKYFSTGLDISVCNIHYKAENGQGYFSKNNSQYFLINNAPSGIKSIIPLVTLFEYYKQKNRAKTFIIEEPELNLFPATQNELMQYMVANSNELSNQLLLTTHSPYVLTALSNMMYAYQVGNTTNVDEVNAILAKKYWMNPDDVSAYMMLADGTCEDIVDRKEGMIKTEKIDSISSILNKQFDKLIEIEHNDIAG